MQFSLSIVAAFSFLLFLISLHLFFAKRGHILLNRLFSVVFFARAGQLVIYLLVASGRLTIFPVLLHLFIPFYFAAPACLYLYVNAFVNKKNRLGKSDWFHVIPFVLAVVHVIPWSFSAPVHWEAIAGQIMHHKQLYLTENTGLFPAYFYYLGRPLLWAGYLFAAWKELIFGAHIAERKHSLGNTWITFCLFNSSFFNFTSIVPLLFGIFPQPALLNSLFILGNCGVLLLLMSYLLHQPGLLYRYLFIAAVWKDEEPAVPEPPVVAETAAAPPKNNVLSSQMVIYTEAMKTFMDTERPYLQPGFQIIHLARTLDIPVHHCSFVINNVIGKNFRDWINAYRVRDFIRNYPILAERMTIEAIAFQSGFKSVATFYNAFKKETGSMPKAYFNKIPALFPTTIE